MLRSRNLAAAVLALLAAQLLVVSVSAGRANGIRFHAESQSWTSAQRGWLLGSTDCATGRCTGTLGTSDGGTTWKTLGGIAAPLTNEDATGLMEIRFADAQHGWAFEPGFWSTSDGGQTWQQQATPNGKPVLALAADAQVAYLALSSCDFGQSLNDCKRGATLWQLTPGQATWTQVSLRLPVANAAELAVFGSTAYLVLPTLDSTVPDVIDVTTDGAHWSSRSDPCSKPDGEWLSSVAPWSATSVALLCQEDIGFGFAGKRVVRSSDAALTTSDAGIEPLYGIASQLAAASDGTLITATSSIGSWIYRNAGDQAWTTSEDLGDGGIGWNDPEFTSSKVGYVIHGPSACCGNHGPGELWQTLDGGLTWRQQQVSPQP